MIAVLLTLTACAGSSASPPVEQRKEVELPAAPEYARRVDVRRPAEGEDPLIIAGRERGGRGEANDRLECFVEWYRLQVAHYGRREAEAQAGTIAQECATRIEQRAKKGAGKSKTKKKAKS